MAYELLVYEKLIKGLEVSASSLCKHHHCDSIEKLPPERKVQILFLFKIAHLLNEIAFEGTSQEKDMYQAKIITAAIYFIMEKINKEYKYSSSKNSNLYCCLESTLGLSSTNQLNAKVLEELYGELDQFICSKVFIKGDPSNGYVEKHPFSQDFIKGYVVKDDIKMLRKVVCNMSIDRIDEADKLNEKTKVSSLSGSWWGKNKETGTSSHQEQLTLNK